MQLRWAYEMALLPTPRMRRCSADTAATGSCTKSRKDGPTKAAIPVAEPAETTDSPKSELRGDHSGGRVQMGTAVLGLL